MREVRLQQPPSRIVSLVPSITELLSDLGLDDSIAGITKFCIYPERVFRSKTRVGGTKKVAIEKIRSLKPDLIIANKEENIRTEIETLATEFPVWVSDVQNLEDALEMISGIGSITGKTDQAQQLNEIIATAFKKLQPVQEINALYLVWRDPYMAAGGDTFINSMLSTCGFTNLLSARMRYPEITLSEMKELKPELVLLSSEPYPFREKHVPELEAIFPSANIQTVDGTYFSWYGSRLQHAPGYFNTLLSQFNFQIKKNTAV